MTEPTTEAGKRLVDFVTALIHPTDPPKPSVIAAIAAIEAEAVTAALDALAVKVGLILSEHRKCGPKYEGCYSHWPHIDHCRADGMAWPCDCATVLALIAEARR